MHDVTHDVQIRERFGKAVTERDERRFERAMDDLAKALGLEGYPADPEPDPADDGQEAA